MESSGDAGTGEDVEDSSDTNTQLDRFREKWQAEIKNKKLPSQSADSPRGSPVPAANQKVQSKQELAQELYMNGLWAEQNGLVYEAMEYYRKATKLVPDIDIQMTAQYRQSIKVADADRAERLLADEDEQETLTDLCTRFNQHCSTNQKTMYCTAAEPQRSTHISALPGELLTYLLRWVVSSDVDARSLEQISLVCRGFYVLARDHYLWQKICSRTWGDKLLSYHPHTSWRSMYLEKPHLYFHGVYMNRVELYRQGEATVEKYYPPWLKVVYYRYLRFFANGQVLMHTSAADPITVISQLRESTAKLEGMCKGMYRMKENQVSCILERVKRKEKYQRYRRRRNEESTDSDMTFYIDLSLHGHGSQPNVMLCWEKYFVRTCYPGTGNESITDFKLTKQDFPACKFARVKSYSVESTAAL